MFAYCYIHIFDNYLSDVDYGASSVLNLVGEAELKKTQSLPTWSLHSTKRRQYLYASIYNMMLRRTFQIKKIFIEEVELRVTIEEWMEFRYRITKESVLQIK